MKHKRIRVRWFVSFFVVLLISMIPAALIHYFSIDAIENQALETNRAHQKLLEQTLESIIKDVDRVADNLTVNSEFAFLRNISHQMTTEQRWRLYQFGRDSLRYMLLDDTFVKTHYVYLKNSDILLSKNYSLLSLAYDSEMLGTSLSLDEWRALFEQKHTHTYIPATFNSQNGFFYLKSLRSPTGKSGEYDVVLIMFVSGQAVADAMADSEGQQDSVICVLDENNQLILSNVKGEKARVAFEQAQHEQSLSLDDERYFCQISQSEKTGLIYICYSSYENAYRQAQLVRQISLIFLLVSLMVGLMLALALTRQHYKPVKKIISRIDETELHSNEYDAILSYITQKQSTEQNLQHQLEEKQRILHQEQLARFLSGRMQFNADVLRLLMGSNISLDRAKYAVAVISMSEFSTDTGSNMAHNVAELMREMLQRKLPELSSDETLMDMNLLVLLLGMDSLEEEVFKAHMQELVAELRTSYCMEMAVGLSNLSGGIEHWPELYRQATAALEFAQLHRESQIVCYPPAMGNTSYSYPLEKEMLLIQAVSGGQAEQAMEILDEVFEMALHQPNIVLQECLRVDLIATCLRIFAFADKIVPRESWEGHGAGRRLMWITKLPELFDEIRDVLTRVCTVIAGHKEQSKETQSGRIRKMVEAEWMDASLSVASIAEKLNLHPSYVSRLFKEEQGIGLLEYINRFRVEQAIRLLTVSNISISEIAARCGYTSDASFIRVFRQYRGMTPGKYREEVKND